MKNLGQNLLMILLFAGIVILFLLVRYIISLGANTVSDKIHNTIKRKAAVKLPQGRFRLADRYNGALNALTGKTGGENSEPPQMRPVSDRDSKNVPRKEDALAEEEWEIEEDSVPSSEWELDTEAEQHPSPSPKSVPRSVKPSDPYSAPQPVLGSASQSKPTAVQSPEPPAERPKESKVPQHISSEQRISPAVADVQERIPPFQENRCCICNKELGGKYAVLFRAETGAEARIDRDCAVQFNTIVKSTDPEKIVDAGRYLVSRYDAVDPKVAPYLKKYAKVAYERLKQWKETN